MKRPEEPIVWMKNPLIGGLVECQYDKKKSAEYIHPVLFCFQLTCPVRVVSSFGRRKKLLEPAAFIVASYYCSSTAHPTPLVFAMSMYPSSAKSVQSTEVSTGDPKFPFRRPTPSKKKAAPRDCRTWMSISAPPRAQSLERVDERGRAQARLRGGESIERSRSMDPRRPSRMTSKDLNDLPPSRFRAHLRRQHVARSQSPAAPVHSLVENAAAASISNSRAKASRRKLHRPREVLASRLAGTSLDGDKTSKAKGTSLDGPIGESAILHLLEII